MDLPLFDTVAAVLTVSAPSAMLTAYDAVIRHLAEVYDTHPDHLRHWRPEREEGRCNLRAREKFAVQHS